MHLRVVELRDWRSYRHARFEFPSPSEGRNVILIRAPNEHGKTSFFEALSLGLYGREGLFLVPRARVATNGELSERLAITYSQFLAGALHKRALAQGRQSCSVTLEFEDAEGDSIELTRKWHFTPSGQHKPSDDELVIYEGVGRRPVLRPASIIDPDSWYREFISKTFLPVSLAEFFLFDGEQVQRYASRDMAAQVRQGIEGLLGLPVLKSLKESLLKYAQARRSAASAPSDGAVKALQAEIARLEAEIAEHRKKFEEAASLLPPQEAESDELVRRLGIGGEGTMALVGELFKEEERHRAEAERATEALKSLMGGDIALALAGPRLRNATIARLRSEKIREDWEAGKNQGGANLERYVADLVVRLSSMRPPLDDQRLSEIVNAARDAWHALWFPAPEGCAETYLHAAIRGLSRDRAIERLELVGKRSLSEVSGLVSTIRSAIEIADAKKRERLKVEQTAPEAERLSRRLKDVSEEIGRLRQLRDAARNAITALEGQLANKRAEFGRCTESIRRGEPALRKAAQAESIVALLDAILAEAVPTQVRAIAEAMTKAWKSMAHMSDRVDRIDITDECQVRMLNNRGENLHEIEKSAGASQVFTQALIWAVTHVSGQRFPFVVDTPLARLSREQRLGVLKTFTDRPGQVILLSTDEEVVDDKLEAIRDRILAAYQLRVHNEDGVCVTTVENDRL
ncbi:MAG: AAA family ATPase [Casimicrobiaceae bacterium]|nr:AAA family ATPase [Casimicrobiaceae bacterium]